MPCSSQLYRDERAGCLVPVTLSGHDDGVPGPSSIASISEQILQALAYDRISKANAAVMFQSIQGIMAGWKIPPAGDFDPDPDPEPLSTDH